MIQHLVRNTAIVCALAGGHVYAAVQTTDSLHDFSRYQVIIDRLPFGAMNAADSNTPQPPFSARYTFVGMAKEDDAKPLLAVIFDKQESQTYFKAEGEMIGDTTVIKIEKADKAPTKLVLKQGLEVATLFMETKTGVGAAPPTPSAQPQPAIPGLPVAPVPVQPGVRRIPFRRGG